MPREAPVTRAIREARGRGMVEGTYVTISRENQTPWKLQYDRLCRHAAGCQRWRQFAQDGLVAGSLRGRRFAERPDLCPEREHRVFMACGCAETGADTQGADLHANAIARHRRHPQRV